jgi:hypothetical protein
MKYGRIDWDRRLGFAFLLCYTHEKRHEWIRIEFRHTNF